MSMKMLVGVQHVVIMFTVGQLMCAGYTLSVSVCQIHVNLNNLSRFVFTEIVETMF